MVKERNENIILKRLNGWYIIWENTKRQRESRVNLTGKQEDSFLRAGKSELKISRMGIEFGLNLKGNLGRLKLYTVEPRFNEVAGDRPNLFVKWRVRYIEVLFHTFYCNFGRDIEIISFVISRTSLNRGSLNRGSTVHVFVLIQGVPLT